jgi:hypothetical protein
VADSDEPYGVQGAFLIEAGISSSYHIASFFGLTEWMSQTDIAQTIAPKQTAEKSSLSAPVPTPADLTETLRPLTTIHRRPEHRQALRRRAIDVSAVITRALTAAGLMK